MTAFAAHDASTRRGFPSLATAAGQQWIRSAADGRFVLGQGSDGVNVVWDLQEDPHALVVGSHGSGKTTLVALLAYQAAAHPDTVGMVVCSEYQEAPESVLAAGIRYAPISEAMPVIGSVLAEVEQRVHGGGTVPRRRLIVVIEDAEALGRAKGACPMIGALQEILTEGPAVDVHVVVTAVRANSSWLGGPVGELLSARCLLSSADARTVKAVLGVPDLPGHHCGPGQGWLNAADNLSAVQIPHIDPAAEISLRNHLTSIKKEI